MYGIRYIHALPMLFACTVQCILSHLQSVVCSLQSACKVCLTLLGPTVLLEKNVRICQICKQNSKLHWTLALGSGTFLDVAPDPSNCLVRIIAYIYVCDSYFYGIPTFEGVPHTHERTDIVMDFEDPEKLDCPSSFPFLSFLVQLLCFFPFYLFFFLSTP